MSGWGLSDTASLLEEMDEDKRALYERASAIDLPEMELSEELPYTTSSPDEWSALPKTPSRRSSPRKPPEIAP